MTDAILSSAQPCNAHCARVRVHVCVWGGGAGGRVQGRDLHAQISPELSRIDQNDHANHANCGMRLD